MASEPVSDIKQDAVSQMEKDILRVLRRRIGKDQRAAKQHDWYASSILTLRDHIIDAWIESTQRTYEAGGKRVYYLSMEFLIGRLLRDALSNLGVTRDMEKALASFGLDLAELEELEPDAALGNGGLGRLAACFMESLATLDIPAYGYGIRYVNGMFRQRIDDGWQVELPETWLAHGNPWEFERLESTYRIGFGGEVIAKGDGVMWNAAEEVDATAVDTPVVGWRGKRVNTLRLWTANPIDPLKLDAFNAGDHFGALAEKVRAEALVRVLYPADSSPAGQELRLRQEYFFTAASIQDIVRRHVQYEGDIRTLPDKAAIQLNDTHPSVAVAELMRVLVDLEGLEFNEAWEVTKKTISYTNHTLLPEALETWPLPLFERLLPRHMQIIYAINSRVLREARKAGLTDAQIAAISLIDESGERRVRMANLAFVGAHSINGVAALHTDLMKETVFADLHALYPSRINNKTNGVTPRRWLQQCNPGLTKVIRDAIGPEFLDDAAKLSDLNALADDAALGERIAEVKRSNKVALADYIKRTMGIRLDPDAMFDVQIKRIHEYKRQLLNLIETVALYDQIRSHPERDWVPRVKIFGGKAASSYHNAKLIIKLANDIARRVNSDPSVGGLLKVVYVPNYNVSLAERIIPAADLSEQISTAGMEASGTGNMKFALNGALTIGTLDGANVEIKEHVGDENIVIFGLTAEEVAAKRAEGYNPRAIIEESRELGQALSAIASGVFSHDDPHRYEGLVNGIYEHDWFMCAADFDSYTAAQREVDARWENKAGWRASAIRNIANVGWFSSDRTISEYAKDIWKVL
ncbi:glycogen/starch/alpha-glucan phosphorylase [Novosphingobium resinovorum]|jgi:starch phosphorylase|uniref:Alpha-1,4 glucan phosphorylase n=1 Tax=Novosphingobium resinovorum TaxID=158500 RepID=A0A031JPE1_9SPHN|nr:MULTISPECIES: glycogen/starch/alpha-glucan phosphorylase [Novosphingobium]AOR79252.1 glycogen phosphorylase [Novosphingobium resinovorum]EZP79651.1 Phosphorylase [Novosphingobium resinovorum]MBF7014118.1 glycogen/starch/alpha-glucan phosphorylase [Novosphingobium sp. HR1a]WJM26259.1 glycogen/starch/alpha-glucan phosphorylase [Novosphingobium resinovorum]